MFIEDTKIQVVLEFLKRGEPFTIGDIRLTPNNSNEIEIAGWSQYVSFKNLTKEVCTKELNEVKKLFSEMCETYSELKDFVKKKELEFSLYFDDYGKASIKICSEKNENIKWSI